MTGFMAKIAASRAANLGHAGAVPATSAQGSDAAAEDAGGTLVAATPFDGSAVPTWYSAAAVSTRQRLQLKAAITEVPQEHDYAIRASRLSPRPQHFLTVCPFEGWQYIDEARQIQGPFRLQQMRHWHKFGCFRPSLKMRYTIAGAFVPMSRLFAGMEPFESEVVRHADEREARAPTPASSADARKRLRRTVPTASLVPRAASLTASTACEAKSTKRQRRNSPAAAPSAAAAPTVGEGVRRMGRTRACLRSRSFGPGRDFLEGVEPAAHAEAAAQPSINDSLVACDPSHARSGRTSGSAGAAAVPSRSAGGGRGGHLGATNASAAPPSPPSPGSLEFLNSLSTGCTPQGRGSRGSRGGGGCRGGRARDQRERKLARRLFEESTCRPKGVDSAVLAGRTQLGSGVLAQSPSSGATSARRKGQAEMAWAAAAAAVVAPRLPDVASDSDGEDDEAAPVAFVPSLCA